MKWLFFILICAPFVASLHAEEDELPPLSLEPDDMEILAPQTGTPIPAPQPGALLPNPMASTDSSPSGGAFEMDDPSLLLDVENLPLLPENNSFGNLKAQAITPEGAPSLAEVPAPSPNAEPHSKPPPEVFATPFFVGPLPTKTGTEPKNGGVVNQAVPEPPRATASNDVVPGPTAVDAKPEVNVGPRPFAALTPFDESARRPVPLSTPMMPLPGVPDVSVILANGQFYPSKIRLKNGIQTRLLFTTTGKKAAALMIEKLQIQRWIAREDERPPKDTLERAKWEAAREVLPNKITEIVLDPMTGTYSFHDAVTGAAGEITVE